MNNISGKAYRLLLGAAFLAAPLTVLKSQAAFDSLGIRQPEHYFNTVLQTDIYRKPNRPLRDTGDKMSRRLGSYGIRQLNVSFYTPLLTIDYNQDSVVKNTHLLLTGNFFALTPEFDGLPQNHRLVRLGAGIRFVHNTGKKGVWFADISPFITRDVTYTSRASLRMASTFVYSHNPSVYFNWRLGITKSFAWGNRYYLPFIGLRIGRLDKVNFSLQFPRSIDLTIPVKENFILSVFSRAQGGVFNFSNHDSLYFRRSEATFYFARYEVYSGLRCDVKPSRWLSLYFAGGLSTRNNITFYSVNANRTLRNLNYYSYFYTRNIAPGIFVQLGLVLKFGATRSYYNNKNIYDAIDMSNTVHGNGIRNQVPLEPASRSRLNLESVQDLIDYSEY